MEVLSVINRITGIVFMLCYAYQLLYIPLVLFFRKRKQNKETAPAELHRFAILVSARNEETVIGDLVRSLKDQTYPSDYYTVFVVADNCTDRTEEEAKAAGAVVYTRFNRSKVGKGYALNELLDHIRSDYGDAFDGFMVFDADNIVSRGFLDAMNRKFSEGNEIVTAYRNSKNFSSNWISAGYGLWFIRDCRFLNSAREYLNTSSVVSGTGFLFSRDVVLENGGWPYHTLTEDTEFTVDQISKGRRIAYCDEAELYDEQPVGFRQSWQQRERWAKGCLQVFGKYGKTLVKGILKGSFSCFDVTMSIMPAFILSVFSIIVNTVLGVMGAWIGDDILIMLNSMKEMLFGMYTTLFVIGLSTTLTDWKRIHAPAKKKILYMFTFPLFMFTYIPIAFVSLFRKTTWKPIRHTFSVSELRKKDPGLLADLNHHGR